MHVNIPNQRMKEKLECRCVDRCAAVTSQLCRSKVLLKPWVHAVLGREVRLVGPDKFATGGACSGWLEECGQRFRSRQRQLWLTPEKHARLMEPQCLKRDLDGDDIARMVMFLCSDDAGAITSQHPVVDGGRL